MFSVSMFWPGMVLNQGQLSIVVSDWESYLDSLFCHLSCGQLSLLVACIALGSCTFVFGVACFVGDILNKGKCTHTTLHLGPIISLTTFAPAIRTVSPVRLHSPVRSVPPRRTCRATGSILPESPFTPALPESPFIPALPESPVYSGPAV